ncbi:hypothetical protein COBT_002444, partial [Conglomerata obtusa]
MSIICQNQILIAKNTILALPDFTQKFYLTADASDIETGAMLSQKTEDIERIISFQSSTYNETQD